MILDPDGWDLAQEIEALLGDGARRARGPGEAGADAGGARDRDQALRRRRRAPGASSPSCAATVIEIADRARAGDRRRGDPPVRARCDDQEIVDRPRYRELVDELGTIAPQRADLRHPRPRRDRGRRPGDLRRRRDPPLPAAVPRPVGQLAVLGGRAHRADVLAGADLPQLPARGDPAPLRHLGDLLQPGRADDARRRDRGLHLPLVGRAPAPEAGHGRDADLRPADAGRAHVALAALDVCLAHRLCALYDADEPLVEYPTELIDDNKIRAALPRHRRASWSTSAPASRSPAPEMARGLVDAAAPRTPTSSAAEPSSTAIERPDRQRHRRPPPARDRTSAPATCAALVAEIAEHARGPGSGRLFSEACPRSDPSCPSSARAAAPR